MNPTRKPSIATIALWSAFLLGAGIPELGRAQQAGPAGAAASASGPVLQVIHAGAVPTQAAPAAHFTGNVRIQPVLDATPSSPVSAALVSFDKGARAAWHTHPRGQRLVVTSGVGRAQQWGRAPQEIRAGDVVVIPAGVKHWHGAAPSTPMSHIAMQEAVDGQNVVWLEKVTDAQYAEPITQEETGTTQSRSQAGPYADIAPRLDGYTRDVLFGDMWEAPELSKRDRSLITVAALVAGYRMNELPYHLKFARQNGVTEEELAGLITHLAFYAGWPSANSAVEVARRVFAEEP